MNKRTIDTMKPIHSMSDALGRWSKFRISLYSGYILALLVFFSPEKVRAQTQQDKTASDILDKAMGVLINEEGSMAVYFEGIAYDVPKPADIFTLPAYKVYRGGFFINDGKKFEIQLGLMKALCDGKIMVMIDESSKTMVVDSLREKMPDGFGEVPDMDKLLSEHFSEGVLKYQGKETMNGKSCHKIKAEFPEDKEHHVFYWVDESSGKLLLIGEWQGASYDAYWVKKVSRAPANHEYSVNLPRKELETFYGYQVFDFRYISEEMRPKEY